ncbi:MAG: phenylalanine--tRNA ligase subunit beta [Dehalococcoidia bacterium]|nr:phenylalanine--tRNA ligase subunit beta [Dehalococcoidia bacterium]MSQ17426.1 phenylalanine--tRNA ligase subunit beta [Dehalococcoidia bacterium]
MKIPMSWLREYVNVDLPPAELAHRLTMAGVEVGEVTSIGGWPGCVVGLVLAQGRHPNADRLSLCRVSTGTQELEVVCGAPNVAAGQKICFAAVGANVFNTHSGQKETLKPARIRGVVSNGMICSSLELGLGSDHDGIVVLPEDAPLGMPLDQYLGDTILDLEVTPNRLDCLSVLGVAHEVAALTGQTVREPDLAYPELGGPIASAVNISVADPDLCPRYTASVIQGLKVAPSPRWLQQRLERAGLRPVNNVVDVTNYVMLEFNQPLHAFDLDRVREHTVIVRRARPGDTLATLDGVTRQLNPEVLVIADARDPMGIGGIIGGAASEIGAGTTSVLLESASFDSQNNRQTAQSFRLHTDATLRFEKGLRPELAPLALRRATQLILQVAGGQACQGVVDLYPGKDNPAPSLTLTMSRLKKVLGMELPLPQVERVLQSLGFACQRRDPATLQVTAPYWRSDIALEEDLVEEVVRVMGYDTVPTTMLSTPIPYSQPVPIVTLRGRVQDALVAAGMQEIISYPLVTVANLEKVRLWDPERPPLSVTNPLNAEQRHLRPTLRASLLNALAANQGGGDGPFRLFEAGRVFLPRDGQLPEEREVAAGVLAGRRGETSWLIGGDALGFYDAKGVVEWLLQHLGVSAAFQPSDDPCLHPGRCARVLAGELELGLVGELHPAVCQRFDIRPQPVAFFELYLAPLLQALPQGERRFRPISRYPAAIRDLALVVPASVPEGEVHQMLARHPLVVRVELFDVYSGAGIPQGTRSLAFHLHLQSSERTLTAEDASQALQELLSSLERKVGATLRT